MLLYQPKDGYCFNSDSIFLYDFIMQFSPKESMLDVGAGCGIVGLLVARDSKNIELEAVEREDLFVELSSINARVNKIEYKIHQSDFLDLDEEKKYRFICSNPPFYPEGAMKSQNDMLNKARYNTNLPLSSFFKKVTRLLKPNGHFIFCYDAALFGDICTELDRVKLRAVDVRFVHPKINRRASLVMIHVRNNSKSLMSIHPPLIMFDGDVFSKEVENIYKKAATKSIKCTI